MSYQGHVPLMASYLELMYRIRGNSPVKILEIGVDRGQTAIPLMSTLNYRRIEYEFVGVDIRFDGVVYQTIVGMDGVDHAPVLGTCSSKSRYWYLITNSLKFLKSNNSKYDLVLIDGDHNYDTVSQELSHLDAITHPLSLVICDDYGGKHAGKDGFYSKSETHKNLPEVSKHLDTTKNKGGATRAIDEYIHEKSSHSWRFWATPEEPILLIRDMDIAWKTENVVFNPDGTGMMHADNTKFTFYEHATSCELDQSIYEKYKKECDLGPSLDALFITNRRSEKTP